MGNTIIKISEKKINGDWCNITTPDLKEISVNMKSAPKTAELINAGQNEIEVNLVEKNGKFYGWDKQEAKQGGGNKYQMTPEQIAAKQQREDLTQRMIIAQSSLSAACNMYGHGSKTPDQILEVANQFYNWVINTSK